MNKNEYAHGDVEILIDDHIIIVRLSGMFNELGVKKFTDAIKEFVSNLNGDSFAVLINDLKLDGGTPEAYAELEDYNQWLNTQKLLAKAMVIDSATNKHIINALSPSLSAQNIEYFLTEDAAINWLKSELDK
jgi:hypothetical protein